MKTARTITLKGSRKIIKVTILAFGFVLTPLALGYAETDNKTVQSADSQAQQFDISGTVSTLSSSGEPYREPSFVWLESDDTRLNAPSAAPSNGAASHLISMKVKQFAPQYVVVRTGDTVDFPNLDNVDNN